MTDKPNKNNDFINLCKDAYNSIAYVMHKDKERAFIEQFATPMSHLDLLRATAIKANILTAKIDSPFIPEPLNSAGKHLIENGLNLIIGFGWIAGGAMLSLLTGQPINDLDFYFTDQAAYQNTKDSLG